ncbi:MAG: hypothetical protein ACKVOK_02955 [Flavobacteriales bacterium]
MPLKSKHILLANFDFPPNQGIGGRRWAKFAKELVHRGYIVHVIKADSIRDNTESPWTNDVESENIHIYSLPRRYPLAFSHPGKDLLSKIRYRIARKNLYRKEKGTIYDLAIGWEKDFLNKASEIIGTHDVENVIASGAPWYLLVYAAKLKEQFPALNYIADFRDPWLNAKNYGMADLTPDRRIAEEKKFQSVAQLANVITAPNAEMIADLKQMAGTKSSCTFEVLTHFFDADDIPVEMKNIQNDSIRIVYGGDIYIGLEPQLELLRQQIEHIKIHRPELYRKLRIQIFTNSTMPPVFKDLDSVEISPSIGKALFNEINQADYCMILLSDAKRNEPTTKFIEFLAMRKPLVVIAPEGKITSYVRDEKIGFVLDPNVNSSFGDQLNNPLPFNASLNIGEFSLSAVTDKLCALLK